MVKCDRHTQTSPCGANSESNQAEVRPWRKILYERQDHPDNYVDHTFLSSLVKNANLGSPRFLDLVRDTAVVTQRLSIVVLFLVVFIRTYEAGNSTTVVYVLFGGTVFFLLLGLAALLVFYQHTLSVPITRTQLMKHFTQSFKRLCLFGGALLALAPVLKTLTLSYSSDTIWLLSFILCITHLVCHDYNYLQWRGSPIVLTNFQGTVSLNAAIFASVLLASRLASSLHVFGFIFFSFCIFAGFPFLAYHLRWYSFRCHLASTVVLFLVSLAALTSMSTLCGQLYLLTVVLVTLTGSLGLKAAQRYKNHLEGPWDYDTGGELDAENF